MSSILNLPSELLGRIFELAIPRGSPKDRAAEGTKLALSLSEVNRHFRSVAINTPSIWSNVSNKQPSPIFKRCMERSTEHPLCIAIVLSEMKLEPVWSSDFASLVSQPSRWQEFELSLTNSSTSRDQFVLQYYPHLRHLLDRKLHLPHLHTLTLVYPISGDHSRTCYSPDTWRVIRKFDPADADYNFYRQWTTPNLRSVKAQELFPYHTEGSQLTSCEVRFLGFEDSDQGARPLLSMFPHWSKLRHLILQFASDPPKTRVVALSDMGVTALPSLETLYASFAVDELEDFNHPVLNLLDFPNVTKVVISVDIIDLDRDKPDERVVCCPLRDGSLYPALSYFELQYWILGYGRFYIRFDRRDADADATTAPNLELELCGTQKSADEDAGPGGRHSGDQHQLIEASCALSVACTKRLSRGIQRQQPGWQNLTKMTAITVSDDQFALIRDASSLRDWDVQRRPV